MRKRVLVGSAGFLAAVVVIGSFFLMREQRQLSDKMIRLHVVANSDTEEDQTVKLKVRDAVLDQTNEILSAGGDPFVVLPNHLDQIENAANQCLRREGCSERAVVTMEQELFPTREYDTFSLPAGSYTSLRVTIGEGEGRNWWCVVFPSICMSASMDEFEQAAQTAGLTAGEIRLITEESGRYELKFKTIEVLQGFKNLFSN